MQNPHLLIIRFSAIGDVAMIVPVVKELSKTYPNTKITILSRPFARAFFEGLANNVNFMAADLKNEYHGISGLNELFKRVFSKNITHVADFHGVFRSEYLRMRFLINGVKVSHIDKHRNLRKQLCRQNEKVLKPLPTTFENYADVLFRLGFPIQLDQNIVPFPSKEDTLFKDEIRIGIAPGASYKGKIYSQEKLSKLIGLIQHKFPTCKVYIFGEKENPYDDTINVRDICSGFSQEMELMRTLRVMVSMDSANMHIASLVGVPVVSIWGQTHPFAGFMGWGQSEENAVQIDLPCRPCSIYGNKECAIGDFPCLNNITPQQIFDKVVRIVRE